ncbi:hypothetical protein A2154_04725 [Candidatus Gottesmanbacteria bacterium RBG_16_43_7]|uniref:Uncharacterized protein n=1 Tax=Candidatus Gottesmanbacteria bacterium RBG_16_43_7 TaxID=1798373 RepID=A0A1F5Z7P0_9BACT|nr:MAG: hypothetical protein A2154_04725 [Candidatus Gottesmanbacteria bacterium RBG_16_43_7]
MAMELDVDNIPIHVMGGYVVVLVSEHPNKLNFVARWQFEWQSGKFDWDSPEAPTNEDFDKIELGHMVPVRIEGKYRQAVVLGMLSVRNAFAGQENDQTAIPVPEEIIIGIYNWGSGQIPADFELHG